MGRIKKALALEEVLQKDELEEREDQANQSKNKKIKRKRRFRRGIILIFIILFAFYLLSDFSNVRVIDIKGNLFYTKQQLMEKANIKYSMKSLMAPSFLIEDRLEKDPLIRNVDVHKTLDGVIRINVQEENMVGYYKKNNKAYLLVEKEKDVYVKEEKDLAQVPYLVDLNENQRNKYKTIVDKVNKKSIWLVSEISHYETSYDKNMLKLIMQDGHIVYTTMKGLKLLDSYTEMLKALNTTHRCITFVEETNSSYSEKCE